MTQAASPLAPYYPTKFSVDANGKRNAWEAVVLIPFVDAAATHVVVDSLVGGDGAAAAALNAEALDPLPPLEPGRALNEVELRRNAMGREWTFTKPPVALRAPPRSPVLATGGEAYPRRGGATASQPKAKAATGGSRGPGRPRKSATAGARAKATPRAAKRGDPPPPAA